MEKPTATATATAKTTNWEAKAEKEIMEEEGRRGRTMKATEEESNETQTIYWVMPSYAQPFKEEIMQILNREKMTLCKNKTFEEFSAILLLKLLTQTAKTSNN